MTSIDVLVVGGGPAGLAAAVELRRLGAGRVLVAERETALGGIARHSTHLGYGIRDLRRIMTGPAYAAHYARLAERLGVELSTSTTVTSLATGPAAIVATLDTAGAVSSFTPTAVVIATGTRERPRPARLVPGDRSAGVYTTGALQQLVLAGRFTGRRAVVVGAEHVSFSAVATLAHAGCAVTAMVTAERRHQTYAPLAWGLARVRRVPIMTGCAIVEIVGRARVEGVVVRRPGGPRQHLPCDTVIFTGDWMPDHELVRRSGLTIDRGTRAPFVDSGLRLESAGWFAAGNLLHGAETADACALEGRHAARSVVEWLGSPEPAHWPSPGVPVIVEAPLAWVSPNRLRPGGPTPPRGRLLLRMAGRPTSPLEPTPGIGAGAGDGAPAGSPNPHVTKPRPVPGFRHVEIRQAGQVVQRERLRGAAGPNRTAWISTGWIDAIRPFEPVHIRLT